IRGPRSLLRCQRPASPVQAGRFMVTHDPFLLRGLVWCELCRRAMEPAATLGSRYYACESRECPTVVVPAAGLEQLVWRQYLLLYEKTDDVVPTAMRWTALRRRLPGPGCGRPRDRPHQWPASTPGADGSRLGVGPAQERAG